MSSSAPRISEPRERAPRPASSRLGPTERTAGGASAGGGRGGSRSGRGASGVRVRKLERGADDGYSSPLVQGLRSSTDAERLAEEIAFAAARLVLMDTDPPEPLASIARGSADLEERTWRAVQFELDPAGTEEPVSWASGTGAEPYRAWAARVGSQEAAITGEAYWTPGRRFERIFERLGTLGLLDREARFDLLVLLGRLGLYALEAERIFLSGENEPTWAAKRAFGIADPLLLERRAADLAAACHVPLAALDLGLRNWNVGATRRSGRGVPDELEPEPDLLATVRGALGL
ncbi:MAG TPA: hypothetical protein VFN48_08285 [Solirubrobacteraceae bacterium]|nr:hypothetical protein [Solirubrobacteraceae bacterium]